MDCVDGIDFFEVGWVDNPTSFCGGELRALRIAALLLYDISYSCFLYDILCQLCSSHMCALCLLFFGVIFNYGTPEDFT